MKKTLLGLLLVTSLGSSAQVIFNPVTICIDSSIHYLQLMDKNSEDSVKRREYAHLAGLWSIEANKNIYSGDNTRKLKVVLDPNEYYFVLGLPCHLLDIARQNEKRRQDQYVNNAGVDIYATAYANRRDNIFYKIIKGKIYLRKPAKEDELVDDSRW